jgi:hypothetical protein
MFIDEYLAPGISKVLQRQRLPDEALAFAKLFWIVVNFSTRRQRSEMYAGEKKTDRTHRITTQATGAKEVAS